MKGIQGYIRKQLVRNDYIGCLQKENAQTVIVGGLQNIKGTMSVTRTEKRALCAFEDKRYYIDPYTSYSYGHPSTRISPPSLDITTVHDVILSDNSPLPSISPHNYPEECDKRAPLVNPPLDLIGSKREKALDKYRQMSSCIPPSKKTSEKCLSRSDNPFIQ